MSRRGPELEVVPVTLRQANAFVQHHHRHHPPARGCRFVLGVARLEDDEPTLCGVAIVSRPVARHYDDGYTVEVVRTCTDGTPNANSALYGAAWRAARALGFRRLITYTQSGESGGSLRAAGWHEVATRPARRGWDSAARVRTAPYDSTQRTLWEA